MKEERRFIRGIIPGLIFLIELSIILLLVLSKCQKESIIKYFSSRNNIGDPIFIFLTGGAIGYFLGIIHRFFYWACFPLKFSIMLRCFEQLGILILEMPGGNSNSPNNYNRNGAWRIVNEIFYSRKESSLILGPEERNDRLFDNMHSSGTSFMGILVLIIAVVIVKGNLNLPIISIFVILFLLLIHSIEYWGGPHSLDNGRA